MLGLLSSDLFWKFLPHSTLNSRNSLGRNDLAAAPQLASYDTGTLHRQHVSPGLLANRPLKMAAGRFQVARHVAHPGLAVTEARKVESFHVLICHNAPRVIERT
jgi:hypothetical protein